MKRIILLSLLTLFYLKSEAQNLRTFTNLEVATAFSGNTNAYSLYWGEAVQIKSPVPFRFLAGLRFSLINKDKGTHEISSGSTLTSINFTKKPLYTTFAIPLGLELFYKGLGIGVSQEVISFSGKKNFDSKYIALEEGEELKTQGFSAVFGSKQNLTSTVYLIYTFSDSFSIKGGYNRITSTFSKYNEGNSLGYAKLSDDLFSIGIRLNIEK